MGRIVRRQPIVRQLQLRSRGCKYMDNDHDLKKKYICIPRHVSKTNSGCPKGVRYGGRGRRLGVGQYDSRVNKMNG